MTRFDVRPVLLVQLERQNRIMRMGAMFIVAACIAWFAALIVNAAVAQYWSSQSELEMGGIGFIAVVFCLFAWGYAAPPAYLEVDETGIRFESSTGSIHQMRWRSKWFRLVMFRRDGIPGAQSAVPPICAIRQALFRVTQEAFDEVLRQARDQGMTVKEASSRSPPGYRRFVLSRTRSARAP